MATLYISPSGSGTRDGSSLANAGTISSLSNFIDRAGAGGQVLLRADQGAYKVAGQVTVKAGGDASAPVTIRGVDASGTTMNVEIIGTRATDWTTGKADGTEIFRLLSGADHLKFQDMTFKNVGNGAFRIGADIKDLTLEHMQATNVKRFLENTVSSGYSSASVDGLTVRDVDVYKYSESAIKLQYNSRNIVIEDVTGEGDANTPEKYVFGITLNHTAHDVLFKNVVMRNSNARGSNDDYWNGDGFTTERGNYNIRFENTVASGNTDAGYDLKSSNTVLVNAIAEGNNRSYRFWSDSITMENSQSLNPKHHGGSASTDHIWMAEGAHARVIGGHLVDQNSGLTVFDLWKSGATLEVSSTTIDTDGKLSGLGSNSQLFINEGSAPGGTAAGPQTIDGTGGSDRLNGTLGDDTINGLAGDDELSGSGGNDMLIGGAGRDELLGGAGADKFVFNATRESGSSKTVDTIRDFIKGTDKIDLSAIDASTTLSGDQAFLFKGALGFTKTAGELCTLSVNGATEFWGDVNGDGAVDIKVKLVGTFNLSTDDFFL
ncbi:MAG: hypothetical protein K0S56_2183 [Microvirga sp.]|nr:hypothetical protein [Microvirga sp.]